MIEKRCSLKPKIEGIEESIRKNPQKYNPVYKCVNCEGFDRDCDLRERYKFLNLLEIAENEEYRLSNNSIKN